MAKANRKNKLIFRDIEFDSKEELEFYHWLEEAVKYGFISSFDYNSKSYMLSPKQTTQVIKQLKTKTKVVDKHLFNPHQYSPDFWIRKGPNWHLLEDHKLVTTHDEEEFIIDTKGTFQKNDGARSFSINQKWMYASYGIYVCKVVPEKFFGLTWLPLAARLTDKTKVVQKKYTKHKTFAQVFPKIAATTKKKQGLV